MKSKILTERAIIELMREAYEQHLTDLMELDASPYQGQGESETVLDVGLKVRHKKTNLLYTIIQLGIEDVMLQTPDGEKFTLSKKELEKEYRLD